MSTYHRAWAAWAAISVGGFAALETYTQLTHHETLSTVTRYLLGINPPRPHSRYARPAFTAGLIGFSTWFIPHILTAPGDSNER